MSERIDIFLHTPVKELLSGIPEGTLPLLEIGGVLFIIFCFFIFYLLCKYHIEMVVGAFFLFWTLAATWQIYSEEDFLPGLPVPLRFVASAGLSVVVVGGGTFLALFLLGALLGGGKGTSSSSSVPSAYDENDSYDDGAFTFSNAYYSQGQTQDYAYLINAYDRYAVLKNSVNGRTFTVRPHRGDLVIDEDGNLWAPN